jgi:hypothetical protein
MSMITKEKSPMRALFFRDHEISGLRPARQVHGSLTAKPETGHHATFAPGGAFCLAICRRVWVERGIMESPQALSFLKGTFRNALSTTRNQHCHECAPLS